MALAVAMIGLGVISRYYADAIEELPEMALVAACDRDGERLASYARRGVACDRDWRATLGRDEVEAVLVNLPNDLHAEVCGAALRSGRHVCCEKPLALTEADALALDAAAREHGVTLFTAFHRRYNRNLAALVERLAGRAVVRARARYLERIEEHAGSDSWYLDPARCGGGCLADNGPNAFDTLRHLVGPLEVVEAEVERDGRGVDLRARVELRSAGGIPARVELDWAYEGELKDVVVEAAGGELLAADMLAGYPAFKSSLRHEYVGVLHDFTRRVERGERGDEAGVAAVRLVERAYALASPAAIEVDA
jgi:predicted dehydrogenase